LDDNEDYNAGYDNGCAETAAELRGTVECTVQSRIDELEIQKREIQTAINNLAQMKKLIASNLE